MPNINTEGLSADTAFLCRKTRRDGSANSQVAQIPEYYPNGEGSIMYPATVLWPKAVMFYKR